MVASTTNAFFSRIQTYQYDTGSLGNLVNRSDIVTGSSFNNDVGEPKCDQVRNAGIHAVTSAGGVNYSYDKYGNMTARGSESILYDTFNNQRVLPEHPSPISTTVRITSCTKK